MTTSWGHGVEAAPAVDLETEGAELEDQEDLEVEARLASERGPPAEQHRTSGNRLMVKHLFLGFLMIIFVKTAFRVQFPDRARIPRTSFTRRR